MRGFIDRVDLAPGGEAVVYDYKSSSPAPPDRWLGERNFQIALYMRAVEQLLGVRAVGGFYQPLSGRDLRARGAARRRGRASTLDCVRGDARPAAEVRELVEEIARRGPHRRRPGARGAAGGAARHLRVRWPRLHVPVDLPVRPLSAQRSAISSPSIETPAAPSFTAEQEQAVGAPPRSAAARRGGRQRQDLGAGRALRARRARGRHRPGADPRDHLHRARRRGAARAGARAPAGAGRARGRARHRGRPDRHLPRLLRPAAARPRPHGGARPRVRDPRRGRRGAAAPARLSPRARRAPGRRAPRGRRRAARRLRRRPRAADGAGRVRRAAQPRGWPADAARFAALGARLGAAAPRLSDAAGAVRG